MKKVLFTLLLAAVLFTSMAAQASAQITCALHSGCVNQMGAAGLIGGYWSWCSPAGNCCQVSLDIPFQLRPKQCYEASGWCIDQDWPYVHQECNAIQCEMCPSGGEELPGGPQN